MDYSYITVDELNIAPEVDISNYTTASGLVSLSGVINRASRWVDKLLDIAPKNLITEDVSNEVVAGMVDSDSNLVVYPEKYPINSISSLILMLGNENITLQLTDGSGANRYNIDHSGFSVLYPWSQFSYSGTVSVANFWELRSYKFFTKMSYNAGYDLSSIPTGIKDATILLCKVILARTPDNRTAIKRISQGGVSIEYDTDTRDDYQEAVEALQPFMRGVSV
jgi:hypothetical protein